MKKYLKYTILPLVLCLYAEGCHAQTDELLDRLFTRFDSSCVELEYSYVTNMSGVRIDGDGHIVVQDSMWRNEGNGIDIWCDGKTVWTADVMAEEVIIESVDSEGATELTNPALLFVRMDEHFNVSKVVDGPDGSSRIYILEPKTDFGMEFFNVEVRKSDASICSGSFALADGNSVKITVASMKNIEKKPVTFYRPSQTFDSSWIVTDLR